MLILFVILFFGIVGAALAAMEIMSQFDNDKTVRRDDVKT